MSGVILANIDGDVMAPSVDQLSNNFLQASAAAAKRMIWIADHEDLFISPSLITPPFLQYVNKMKGGTNICALALSTQSTQRLLPISDKKISEFECLQRRAHHIGYTFAVSYLEPYLADETSLKIARVFGNVPVTFSNRKVEANLQATRYLNDKAEFRKIAKKLDIPIANGVTCKSRKEMIVALDQVLSITGSAILKMARHSSGDGNFIISLKADKTFLGAKQTVIIKKSNPTSYKHALREIKLTASEINPVIIESYFENETAMGVHFDVQKHNVIFVGTAQILFDPENGYGGAFWCKTLTDTLPQNVFNWCQKIASYAKEIGYIGPLSVDIVKGKKYGFFACEVNGRHGGFSTLKAVATSLGLEHDIAQGSVAVLARNHLHINTTFTQLIDFIERKNLHYNFLTKSGVVVVVEGHFDQGPFDFAFFGANLQEIKDFERQIFELQSAF